eukprot:GFUD01061151.1.p2 GENE.GFUD01061151.1~~GFUD01061151.1.p2  ORF type:complete len:163 (-),score=41.42 GFUD01061151.1:80-568(-)
MSSLIEVFHSSFHVLLYQCSHLCLEMISSNPSYNLRYEDSPKQAGKCESHTVVLLDSTTTSKERDYKDDTPEDDDENRSGEEVITKKVQILSVGSLEYNTSHNQQQARYSENEVEEEKDIFDTVQSVVFHCVFSASQKLSLTYKDCLRRSLTVLTLSTQATV